MSKSTSKKSLQSTIKLCSWNVNGIRAVLNKGFDQWLANCNYDVICLQETKAQPEQIPQNKLSPEIYTEQIYNSAERKGYSGTANLINKTKLKVIKHNLDFTDEISKKVLADKDFARDELGAFNNEGRLIKTDFELNKEDHSRTKFSLLNFYFPNGGSSKERYDFKLRYYDFLLAYLKELLSSQANIILTGDFNTAHHPIDLARPKENIKTTGFIPEEREYLDRLNAIGFADSLRMFTDKPELYSWWSYRTAARKRNVGWRIDYFWVSENMKQYASHAEILNQVEGSDHCPISLELLF